MSFFKTIFASAIGVFLAFVLFFLFILTLSIGSLSSGQAAAPYIPKKAVLTVDISGIVSDRIPNDPFSDFAGEANWTGMSLEGISATLDFAAKDERIYAVWLKTSPAGGSWALLNEVRKRIARFKSESGKPVYASADDLGFNEASWFVASVADSIFSAPEALFEMDGFYLESYFLKGLFDKIGIEPEILRFGKYKGAVEPYILKEFSKENESQLKPLLEVASADFLNAAAAVSGSDTAALSKLMNEAPRITSSFALEAGLLHGFAYPEQMERKFLAISDTTGKAKFQSISAQKYLRAKTADLNLGNASADKIAVLYMSGMILPEISEEFGDATGISYTWFVRQLKQIEKDKRVKAIVLRIDSPGGSGSTSDLIWNRIRELRLSKPVVASVGDVAASGGYYIAMAADTIVIHPASVTGSIGVFSTKFNASKMFEDKIGITFDQVKTHNHADWFTFSKGLSAVQRNAFQQFQDDFYTTFIRRVAESRKMEPEAVHAVAQGRVWTGKAALEIGLADVEGSLDDAIALAAARAGLATWETDVFPRRKTFLEILMSGDFGLVTEGVKSRFTKDDPAAKIRDFVTLLASQQHRLNVFYPVSTEIR